VDPQASFADAQALSTCLAIEGFLLATVSLAGTLGSAGRRRVAKLPIPASAIALSASVLCCLLGTAALASWIGLYGTGDLLPFRQLWIALMLLLAVVVQPIIAVLLALGTRSED
jgi:hypothetical protein